MDASALARELSEDWRRDPMNTADLDRWHFRMLNDKGRNQAYRAAIRRRMNKDRPKITLDLGSGSGLLALYARQQQQQHGPTESASARVVACEANPSVVRLAKQVLRRNGAADTVRLEAELSTGLDVRRHGLDRNVELLITETFDAGLLGEHALASLDDAWRRLLSPSARVVPARALVRCALLQCPEVERQYRCRRSQVGPLRLSDDDEEEVCWLSDALQQEPYTSEALSRLDHALLTRPAVALAVDFESPRQIERLLHVGRAVRASVSGQRAGRVDAVAVWFDLQLTHDEGQTRQAAVGRASSSGASTGSLGSCQGQHNANKDISETNGDDATDEPDHDAFLLSTAPDSQTSDCWEQAIFPLQSPFEIGPGEKVEVCFQVKGHLSLTSCRSERLLDKQPQPPARLRSLPSALVAHLNDAYKTDTCVRLAETVRARFPPERPFSVLDLTKTFLTSLLLLQANLKAQVSLDLDLSCASTLSHLDFVVDVAKANGVDLARIQCVSSVDTWGDDAKDAALIVLLDPVLPSGRLDLQLLSRLRESQVERCNDLTLAPSKVILFFQLIECQTLWTDSRMVSDDSVHGLKIRDTINTMVANQFEEIDLAQYKHELLSLPMRAFDMDTLSRDQNTRCQEYEVVPVRAGQVHAIVYWFEYDYLDSVSMSTREASSHKLSAFVLDEPRPVVVGENSIMVRALERQGYFSLKIIP